MEIMGRLLYNRDDLNPLLTPFEPCACASTVNMAAKTTRHGLSTRAQKRGVKRRGKRELSALAVMKFGSLCVINRRVCSGMGFRGQRLWPQSQAVD